MFIVTKASFKNHDLPILSVTILYGCGDPCDVSSSADVSLYRYVSSLPISSRVPPYSRFNLLQSEEYFSLKMSLRADIMFCKKERLFYYVDA